MKIDELTISEAKELAAMFGKCEVVKNIDSHWKIGKVYLIRTVTMIDTGKLVAVTPQELVLENAAWIASTGRFSDALKKCEFGEVEPFPDGEVIIGRGAIIEAVVIKSAPRDQK
jgi:hypothetical protein